MTNYSINKKHSNFFVGANQDGPPSIFLEGKGPSPTKGQGVKSNIGNKWSLGALNKHLKDVGIDVKLLWNRIYDSINKCLLAGEPLIVSGLRRVLPNR